MDEVLESWEQIEESGVSGNLNVECKASFLEFNIGWQSCINLYHMLSL